MLRLVPAPDQGRPLKVLGLAAHPDDLEIGCAGTLIEATRRISADVEPAEALRVRCVVMTGSALRVQEARDAATSLLGEHLDGDLVALGLQDGLLPAVWAEAKAGLRSAAEGFAPDLVLVPAMTDAHQDHRLLSEVAWQLFRQSTIWEYEIPKWEADAVHANVYVPLSEETMSAKIALLRRQYHSQRSKPWYDEEVFRAVCRLRGTECGSRYAEGFVARKVTVCL